MKIKNLFLCGCLCGSMAAATTAARPVVADDGHRTDIAGYFSACLRGQAEAPYGKSRTFSLKQTDRYRRMVWEAWQQANGTLEEEKLPAIAPLSESSAGAWQLPEALEPDATMPFYWGSKGEQEPEGGYPLYLYLHGSGPKAAEWKTGLAICRRFDDAPSVYFIPQIPNEGGYYRWWQKAKQYAWEKLLRQSLASGHIQPDRVYMFGISEGGYGSQRLASFYADYLAGAGPMAGGEPLKNAPAENCANIAFSLLTGDKDYGFYRNILSTYVRQEFDSLQQAHPGLFTHRIELIPGRGHSIDYSPTTPWLKQHVRNPYPKYVYWEDFEMDGLHRKGFYNIAVGERSNEEGKTRTCYEMKIEGNHVDLTVSNVTYETVQKDPRWGIEMKFKKHYAPATRGKVTLYLCNELVDLQKKVTVTVNGKQVFHGKLKPDVKHLVNSCRTFFDPRRVYPAAVEINL